LTEDRLSLPCYEGPSRALSRLWKINSERLFSSKETLKTESREAEIGTQRTLRKLQWAAEKDPQPTFNDLINVLFVALLNFIIGC
jgi:hypothetical protein